MHPEATFLGVALSGDVRSGTDLSWVLVQGDIMSDPTAEDIGLGEEEDKLKRI